MSLSGIPTERKGKGLAAPALEYGAGKTERGMDHRQMRQRLREVASEVLCRHIELLRQQTQIVGDREHALELRAGFLVAALQRQAVGHPARASEERTFFGLAWLCLHP